jgi:hypothetical protein
MSTSDSVPGPPPVILNGITVKIKTGYFFRAACLTGFREGALEAEDHLLNIPNNLQVEIPRVQVPGKWNFEPQARRVTSIPESHLDVGTLKNTTLITPRLDPTFSTINVAINHRVKIKLSMTCGDKKFSYDCADTLLVLPSRINRQSVRPATPEEVDPLPLYTRTSIPTDIPNPSASSSAGPMAVPNLAELPPYTRAQPPAHDMTAELPAYQASEVRG